jgi:hypothetical protein
MATSAAFDACARLQLKIENGESAMYPLRQELLQARELLQVARINYLSNGKTDESKLLLAQAKGLVIHLQGIVMRCEQSIKCTDNCIELMEMEFPGIVAESRTMFEQYVLQANKPLEKVITEMVLAPTVNDILANDGNIPGDYKYPNVLAQPSLEQLFSPTTTT